MIRLTIKRGFTLIELLIVIAIIGILAALIIVSLQGSQKKAGDADRKTKAKSLATAVEQYFVDHTSYPFQSGSTDDFDGIAIQSGQRDCATLINLSLVSVSTTKRYLEGSGACLDKDPTNNHQYRAVDNAQGKKFLIAWQLAYQNEDAKLTTDSGNGVYKAVNGTSACNNTEGGNGGNATIGTNGERIAINCLAASNFFVVYGPQ